MSWLFWLFGNYVKNKMHHHYVSKTSGCLKLKKKVTELKKKSQGESVLPAQTSPTVQVVQIHNKSDMQAALTLLLNFILMFLLVLSVHMVFRHPAR